MFYLVITMRNGIQRSVFTDYLTEEAAIADKMALCIRINEANKFQNGQMIETRNQAFNSTDISTIIVKSKEQFEKEKG